MAGLSIVVAVGLTSLLLFLLFQGTTGPGEQIRSFYSAVGAGDCPAAFAILTPDLQSQAGGESTFCSAIAARKASFAMPDVKVSSVLLEGDSGTIASVAIEGDPRASSGDEGQTTVTWRMVSDGDNWLIQEFPRTWSDLSLT